MSNTLLKFNTEDSSTNNSHLSIEINGNVVNLALLNLDTHTYFGLESISNENDFLSKSELLKTISPKSVSCSINNLFYSLVPSALFDENNIEAYLNLSASVKGKTNYSISETKEVITCYKAPEELLNYILRKFPNAKFYHFSTIFISSIAQGVHINFSSESTFECAFVNEKGLLFYNGYEYNSPEETLYFLSLICDKFELDVQKIKISVSGDITSKIKELWDNYIPKNNLQYKNTIEFYSFSNSLASIEKHKYFSLLKQHTCV